MKNIILTGGNGFLGRYIADAIPEFFPESEVFIPQKKNFNLCREADVQRLFAEHPCDLLIHSACLSGGLALMQKKPDEVFYTNLQMNSLLVAEAKNAGVKKFVGIGSGLIYPQNTATPYKEENIFSGEPHALTACYGIPSRVLFQQGMFFRNERFNFIYVIPANLYGPRDHFTNKHSHVIPSLIKKFSSQEIVTLWGTGNTAREFMYVEDAARAILTAARDYEEKEPINIGTGIATPIKELAELIAQETNFSGKTKWDTTKPEGDLVRCFDVSRMREKLKFQPKINLATGIKKTIAWYNEQ